MQSAWRTSFLSGKELRIVAEIERKNGAKVRLSVYPLDGSPESARLVSAAPKYDEEGDLIDDPDELSYLADHPKKTILSPEELEHYPSFIQYRFPINAERVDRSGSCNVLSTCESGVDFETILLMMLDKTVLLEMGWHLGRKEEFDDPFDPETLPKPLLTEEEQRREDYFAFKQEEEAEEDERLMREMEEDEE